MTDREKAIVMAHTGICMLEGEKFEIFHKYVENILGRPILTHEMAWLADDIKEKSRADFIALCEESEEETITEFADKCRECGSILGRNTKQKTGRWLSHKEYCEKHDLIPSGLVTLEWCSNCDFGIDINEMHGEHYKYCPNCGAKMEE